VRKACALGVSGSPRRIRPASFHTWARRFADERLTLREAFNGFTLTQFDGEKIVT
jgi:hypothetical protein